MVQCALVVRPAGRAAGEFVEDVRGAVERHVALELHRARDGLDPPPVWLGLAGGRDDLLHQRHAALAVAEDARLFEVHRRGQDDMRVARRLRRVVRVLYNHQLGLRQRVTDGREVRHRGRGIRADDPDRANLTAAQRFEHPHRVVTRLRPDVPPRKTPERFHLRAVLGIRDEALVGERVTPVAAVAAAHRIGLAGPPERAAAWLAALPEREVQVDDPVAAERALERLLDPHRPERAQSPGSTDDICRRAEVVLADAADLDDARRRVFVQQRVQRFPTLRMCRDKGVVDAATVTSGSEQIVEQREVGAGTNGEVYLGTFSRRRATRVYHHAAGLALAQPFRDAVEDNGVALGRVGSDEQEGVGQVDVLVARGRTVAPEREGHAARRAGHAQPAVAVHVIRTKARFSELAGEVLRFGRQLSGQVERDRAGPVLLKNAGQLARDVLDGGVARDHAEGAAGVADHREAQPRGNVHRLRDARALLAQSPQVGRVRRVAAHLQQVVAVGRRQDPATDAAVRAEGFDLALHQYTSRAYRLLLDNSAT